METLKAVVDLFLHLDKHLEQVAGDYGPWIYLILFVIVFCETGLVVTPFLPGDSLLFAAGALAAVADSSIHVGWLCLLLIVAAVLGDTVNYHCGVFLGPKVLRGKKSWLFNVKHLERTERFFARHGGKTIIIARFVPIIRTFAPFVAGVGAMKYRWFLAYNVIGGVVWVVGFLFAGYFFGSVPVVKRNFTLVILAIIFLSIVPGLFEFLRHRSAEKSASRTA